MKSKVAVSLAPTDTATCLDALHALPAAVRLAEICLDLMASFDLPRLIERSPCPLILTCRPTREGGRFAGPETERLAILQQAMDLNCAYIDIEWDSRADLGRPQNSATQVIVSRHWSDSMPPTLQPAYEALLPQADVVKLVGMARKSLDILPVLDLLAGASTPVIALAMGDVGQPTRLLAPYFPQAFLTYASATEAAVTAPGQLSVETMLSCYHLDAIDVHTALHVHLCADASSASTVVARNAVASVGKTLSIPMLVNPGEAPELLVRLQTFLPRLTITADPAVFARAGVTGHAGTRGINGPAQWMGDAS